MTVLLGSSGVCWSADFQKGVDAFDRGDYATALKEWTPLAEQGFAKVQHNLGVMYRNGQGVPQDDKTAVKWFTLAAEQRDVRAQTYLGLMYANGDGVPQDYVRAHMWFNLSASIGHENAIKGRDIVANLMTPADISAAQKLARECAAKNYKGC
jgi:uncharacterized protein